MTYKLHWGGQPVCPNTDHILSFHLVRLLAEIVDKNKNMVWNIHNHDSLLENKVHSHPTLL